MKKVFNVLLAFAMLLAMTATAFAAAPTLEISVKDQENVLPLEGLQIQPMSWGGAAAQVTNIELYDRYIDPVSGHFFVVLKVTGYGHDTSYFNGKEVTSTLVKSFTLDGGPGADGFIWSYDCGEVTEPGDYIFTSVYTSTNYPYSQKSFKRIFTFEYAS